MEYIINNMILGCMCTWGITQTCNYDGDSDDQQLDFWGTLFSDKPIRSHLWDKKHMRNKTYIYIYIIIIFIIITIIIITIIIICLELLKLLTS